MNSATVNIHVQVFLLAPAFISGEYITRRRFAGSHTPFYIPTRVPISPHPYQHLFFSIVVVSIGITTLLANRKWYITLAFICISLVTNDVEHLFMCLLVTCITFVLFWRNVYSTPLAIFNCVVFLLLNYSNSSYMNTSPLSYVWFASTFAHSVGCLFHFSTDFCKH